MSIKDKKISWKDVGCVLLYLKPEDGSKVSWFNVVNSFREVLKATHPNLVDEFNKITENYYSPEQRKALEKSR